MARFSRHGTSTVADDSPARSAASIFWHNWRIWPTLLVAVLVIWVFGWMYMGVTWGLEGRTHNLKAAVLNCDRGYSTETLTLLQTIGLPSQPISTTLFSQSIYNSSSAASTALGWHNTSCIQGSALQPAFDAARGSHYGCPAEVEAACFADLQQHILNDDDYFFALYVPGNFSSNFAAALTNASDRGAAYIQMSMNYVYPQGRSYSTYAIITSVLTTVISSISTTLGYTVAANDAITAVSPDFYIAPITLQSFNLAPVRTSGMNFSTYVICVLMWLGCTFIVSAMYPFGAKAEEALLANIRKQGVLDYRRKQGICLVLLKGLIAYLFTLLLMTLLIIILVVEGAIAHNAPAQFEGHNPGYAIAFGWYMSFSFIALDCILINIVGPSNFSILSALLLILQLTSSGGIIADEISQPFYKVGKALPFYYGVKGFRRIFFGAGRGDMWLNWVVLTAWNVGCLPLALVIAAVKARQRVSSKLKAQDQSTATAGDEEVGGGAHGMVGSSNQRSDNGLQQLGDVALLGA